MDFLRCELGKLATFGEVLADQTVGVAVEATLPGRIGMREVGMASSCSARRAWRPNSVPWSKVIVSTLSRQGRKEWSIPAVATADSLRSTKAIRVQRLFHFTIVTSRLPPGWPMTVSTSQTPTRDRSSTMANPHRGH